MPKRHNFTIRLDAEELEWFKSEAKKQHRTVANFIRYLLSLYREGNEDQA